MRYPRCKRFSDKTLMDIASNFSSLEDFIQTEWSAYVIVSRRGLLPAITAHMSRGCERYSDDEIRTVALRYFDKGEFIQKEKKIYDIASLRGLIPTITKHMFSKHISWTDDRIALELSPYRTIAELRKCNRKLYGILKNSHRLKELTGHLVRRGPTSKPEQELLMELRKTVSDVKKLYDYKVTVPGKPFIKRFELDIYSSNCNKGIEFDGTYYHSFEGLKRTKSKQGWTDEDILNYHQIKDGYFATKGIQVLHIKEEDWVGNKLACIQQCLEFLGAQSL